MAKWGKVNFKQLEKLQKRMEKLEKVDFDRFCEAMAKELAARLLAKVIKRTPVGNYDDGTVGGTLRRGWTAGKENMSEKGNVIGVRGKTGHIESLEVTKKGNVYEIVVYNNVEYSQYVEFGHRTRNLQGWVPGRFMMTISAKEVENLAPKLIEKKLMKLLGEAFNGD